MEKQNTYSQNDNWMIDGREWQLTNVGDFNRDGGDSDALLLFEGWENDSSMKAFFLHDFQIKQSAGEATRV